MQTIVGKIKFVVGSLGVSILLGLMLLFINPKTGFSEFYLFPGIEFLELFCTYIPSRLTYWMAPEDGLNATFSIVLIASMVLWAAFIFIVSYLAFRWKQNK